ncbi:sperm-associated antigen 16 protein-like [Stigmatopora argus]
MTVCLLLDSRDDKKDQEEVLDPEDHDDGDDKHDVDHAVDGENLENGKDENGEGDDPVDVGDDHDVGEDKDHADDHEKEEEHRDVDEDDAEDGSLTEGEEDLETTVKSERKTQSSSGCDTTTIASELHVTADDFTRNFLSQMKMTATLDSFQTEWTEMMQKGLLNTKRVVEVPDVYVQNLRLHNELRNAIRERQEYQTAASESADTLAKAQKARDAMWLERKRTFQQRNRLVEEARRLKTQCHEFEPTVRRMDDRFQAVVEQTMRAALGRDKLMNLIQSQSSTPNAQGDRAQKNSTSGNSTFRLCCSKSPNS